MSKRFYVEPPALEGDVVEIGLPLAQRLSRVLRLRAGEEITLFDGSGVDALARLVAISDRSGQATVLQRCPGPPEPRTRVHLYQSITKGERFEWLLEKGTEIGVAAFRPLITERSVVRTTADAARTDRWRRIVVEAAEQCGRSQVPTIEAPRSLEAALAEAPGVLVLPYESAGEHAPEVARALDGEVDALFALMEVSIFIGPEGGFTADEVTKAQEAGATVVTLGQRVLRSETAGLVAATLVLQAVGELG